MSQRKRLAFWPGETVRVQVRFSDGADADVTVSGVTFTARAPDGTTVNITPETTSPASYYADVAANTAGEWAVRATCTGPSAAAVEVSFTVQPSNVI
jgi:uncharacterized protein YfaS (alpha-2-macroglobulin family)